MAHLTDRHFAGLLAVRSSLAVFEWTRDREARGLGTTYSQQHVILALRRHRDRGGPTVKTSPPRWPSPAPAVELIAGMVTARLIDRHSDPTDARVTRLQLTPLSEQLMHQLGEAHLPRLRQLPPEPWNISPTEQQPGSCGLPAAHPTAESRCPTRVRTAEF